MLSKFQKSLMSLGQKQKFLFTKTPQFIKMHTPQFLLNDDPKPRKRTKTVCTIGPKTQSAENAGKLIDEGLSVARLNFSHGDHQQHRNQMVGVQQALSIRPNAHSSILLDTKGPQIRTGNNKDGKQIELKKGQLLQITTDYQHQGTSQRIACSYKNLCKSTQVGKKILIADGGISTIVKKIENQIVTVQVLNDGKIGSRKNMCLPGCTITLPTVTQYDKHDIIDFGLKYKVDYIAVSFARYKSDLQNLRELLKQKDPQHGPNVLLVSKIQNHEAIHNLDQIIQASDGIMIARGDLGMQVPIEKVVILQKYITDRTINLGKFVITATQMLQSMQTKPRPTRAEVSDITNSVYDLNDANMTSGQTTNGQFPFQCAKYLRLIAQQAQASCDYQSVFQHRKHLINDKQAIGAISLSFQLDCHFIFIKTQDIRLINRLSSLRPKAYIIVFTNNKKVKNQLAVNFGVYVYPDNGQYYQPNKFIQAHGINYGIKKNQCARVLALEDQNSKIVSSRIFQVN